jgi:hypothetical protein
LTKLTKLHQSDKALAPKNGNYSGNDEGQERSESNVFENIKQMKLLT